MLELGGNQLTDKLPISWSTLTKLRALDLNGNVRLSGETLGSHVTIASMLMHLKGWCVSDKDGDGSCIVLFVLSLKPNDK